MWTSHEETEYNVSGEMGQLSLNVYEQLDCAAVCVQIKISITNVSSRHKVDAFNRASVKSRLYDVPCSVLDHCLSTV